MMESDGNRRAREEERKVNEEVVGRSESISRGEENVGGRKCTTEERGGKCHCTSTTPPLLIKVTYKFSLITPWRLRITTGCTSTAQPMANHSVSTARHTSSICHHIFCSDTSRGSMFMMQFSILGVWGSGVITTVGSEHTTT